MGKFGFFSLFFASILVFSALSAAAKVSVSTPLQADVLDGGEIDLGTIGPGQKVEIGIASGTGQPSVLDANTEAIWDQLNILPQSLPEGWESKNALIYGANKKAHILASKNAEEGAYSPKLQAIDEYQGAPAITFTGKVTVSEKVLSLDIVEDPVKTSVNQTAVYKLRLRNKSQAADGFIVTISGIPQASAFAVKDVYLEPNSEKTIPFELTIGEPGEFKPAFTATSLSSSRINDGANTRLVVGATLFQEIKTTARGMLLFPTAEQAVIYALGFIANFFALQ